MKRILFLFLALCLVFSLAACGGRSSKADKKDDKMSKTIEDLVKDAEKIDSEEEAEKFVEDLLGWEIEQDGDEMKIKTGFGEDGGEVTFRTGGSLTWNPDNVGGLPQPEGTKLTMEMDMSAIFGKEFSYSYSVTGMTDEVYEEYVKIVKKSFPKVLSEMKTETEYSIMTLTEDSKETVLVTYIKDDDNTAMIQYIR